MKPVTDSPTVKFALINASAIPGIRHNTGRSRFTDAINAAIKRKTKAVVIPTTNMDKKLILASRYSLLSAIKTRGYNNTLKVSKRGDALIIYRIK